MAESASSCRTSTNVFAYKKDGSPCFCFDCRKSSVEGLVARNLYVFHKMKACTDRFRKTKVFSTIDADIMNKHLVNIRTDRGKGACTLRHDLYRLTRFPSQLKFTVAAFKRKNDAISAPIWCVFILVYCGDLVVFMKSPRKFLGHTGRVLRLPYKANLTVRVRKAKCFAAET